MPERSSVNLDWLETVPIAFLTDRIGRLGSERMHEVCVALSHAAGCTSP